MAELYDVIQSVIRYKQLIGLARILGYNDDVGADVKLKKIFSGYELKIVTAEDKFKQYVINETTHEQDVEIYSFRMSIQRRHIWCFSASYSSNNDVSRACDILAERTGLSDDEFEKKGLLMVTADKYRVSKNVLDKYDDEYDPDEVDGRLIEHFTATSVDAVKWLIDNRPDIIYSK